MIKSFTLRVTCPVFLGAYHPKFSEDVNDNDVSENELHTSVKPRNVSREQNLLHKDLKFNQQRYVPFFIVGGNFGSGSGILENQLFIFFLEYFANFDIPKSSKDKYLYSSIYSNQIFLC